MDNIFIGNDKDLYRKFENDPRFELVEKNIGSRFFEEYYVYELFEKGSTGNIKKKLYCKIRIESKNNETAKSKFYYEYHLPTCENKQYTLTLYYNPTCKHSIDCLIMWDKIERLIGRPVLRGVKLDKVIADENTKNIGYTPMVILHDGSTDGKSIEFKDKIDALAVIDFLHKNIS